MLHKAARNALIVIFCGFIAAMGALYLLLPRADFSAREKRVLASPPELTPATALDGRFEDGLENWMNDHIPGREALVGLNAYYELASGRNGLSGAILADGRLYAAAEKLDPDLLKRRCASINEFAAQTGLPVDVLVVPSAGYVCEDALPLHAAYPDGEMARLAREELDANIGFLWPEDALRAGDSAQCYYATDHHLTSRGSYEICKLYAESLGLKMPEASDYEIETYPGFRGSMYSRAGLWGVAPEAVELWHSRGLGAVQVCFDDREPSDSLFFPEHLTEPDMYPVFLDGNHGLVTIETEHEGENLLLIRDSFGHCFAPFAADCFHRIALVDLRYYRQPVSELAQEMEIDRVLVLYGADTFMTDTNFAWLR